MSELPKGWSTVSIADIGEVVTGNTPPTKQREIFYGGNIPFVKPPDLDAGEFLDSANETLSDEGSLKSRLLPANSILVNCIGNIGKVAFSRVACCTNQQINSIVPNTRLVEPKFVYWFIRSPIFQDRLQSNSSATTVSIINKGRFSALEIPLAPLNEQRRIVAKLDRLFARSRCAREELGRVSGLVQRYKQAVLAAAFRGDLTADWRKENKTANWQEGKLSEIGYLGRGKSKHRPRNHPKLYGGDYPFIQTGDIAQSDGIIKTHSKTYSDFGLSQSKLWNAGTVCITIAANIANTAILSYPACFPDSVVGFVCDKEKCLPQFIKWSIDLMRADLESFAPATAQKNINLSILSNIKLNLPSLEEQKEIVKRVEKLFKVIDIIEQEHQKASKLLDRLEKATLSKAFRGELVPQDPNDEPAAVLLERIQAQRQTQPKRKAKSTRKPKAN
ncbi:MAG: restriction endonuclease subunit S [Limnospira sp. PMC 894.15]|uniref:Restriction endonuclease subunit S n=1 Tax=Limnospira fusiformis PMC 851.14 TaxID=2219512 RepID=A0ABU9EM60_LIMFS|nr:MULTISPECIES: restriction endonuclease subunit S [unclassified Limnospira]MDT9188346.1 restriction endonuclease subunit S [Limnospira sp. PMC 894.15]MDT9234104.1 restriction endonuclease subunit S [Limnospira sp. PMC 917.15]MDT9275155.1 restriction endonuclease subunit S [Limnospira sp. PMC 737.11]